MIYTSHCTVNVNAATAITSQTQNRKPRIPQRSSSIRSTVSTVLNEHQYNHGATEEESRSDCVTSKYARLFEQHAL